jgi:hypothetical protein
VVPAWKFQAITAQFVGNFKQWRLRRAPSALRSLLEIPSSSWFLRGSSWFLRGDFQEVWRFRAIPKKFQAMALRAIPRNSKQ